jgi:hypothetical protein
MLAGSLFTVLGVDAEDSEPDLVADPDNAIPDEPDVAIRHGIQLLPRRRESVGRCAGGISRTGSFPATW